MIGIVLVSHSKALALAVRDLVAQMVGPDFPLAVAAGVGDDFAEIGTDAVHIYEQLQPFCAGDGAVVLMDLGSAVLSAQTAVELLEGDGVVDVAAKIRLVSAPLVEAAVAAAVQAKAGADLDAVVAEAVAALAPKQAQLGDVPAAAPPAVAAAEPSAALELETTIANPNGLHARPAAQLVQALAGFDADIQLSNLTLGRGLASVRSLTAVALVQARRGDRVRFTLRGAEAAQAAERLRAMVADHFGEAAQVAQGAAAPPAAPPPETGKPVGAADGVAVGRLLPLAAAVPVVAEAPPSSPEQELARLDAALLQVAAELRRPAGLDPVAAAIFAAQALVLDDPAVVEPVRARLRAGGVAARAAWEEQMTMVAASYDGLDDPYLRARAADLRDVARRVARALAGAGGAVAIAPQPPAVLLTDELLPGEAMACRPGAVLGVLARRGSPTAHAAIILRGLGIPMVVGVDAAALAGAELVGLDGGSGEIWVDPPAAVAADIVARAQVRAGRRAAFDAGRHRPAVTSDGTRVEVLANVGNSADALAAVENGAEGVGLLRTELVYLSFQSLPSEDQQVEALADVLGPLGPGPVVVRTPDIGADKPAPYLPAKAEQNPFLGVRGVRLSLRHPEFFASNLRAILRAGLGRELWIMVPMVTTPDEMARTRRLLEAAHDELLLRDVAHAWPVRLGMMVEVPAAALSAESFTGWADFFSVGTNDLTQYVLASERGNGDLAALADAAHPAVLRLIRDLCATADAVGCHVSVCGDAASDPVTAALLVGAGVRSLSVRPNQTGTIKAHVRQWSRAQLAELLGQALAAADAGVVRHMVRGQLGLD